MKHTLILFAPVYPFLSPLPLANPSRQSLFDCSLFKVISLILPKLAAQTAEEV
jgi:hypothetical protein